MPNIEQNCIDRYNTNMAYIKKIDLDLFNKIILLNTAIEEKLYQERYALEYIEKSFNIRVLSDNTYLYNNINIDAKNKLYEIENKPKSFSGIKNIDIPHKYVVPDDISKGVLESFYPFIEYVEKYTKEKKINNLNKFIFFGCGLSNHIELFIKTYTPKIVMVEENDLEIFRLSLFVTDYESLSHNTDFIFSIMSNSMEGKQYMNKFMDEFSFYNYSIGFDTLNEANMMNINKYLNYIATSDNADFPVSGLLFSLQRHVNLINNDNSKFINFKQNATVLYDLPTLVLAPGPSLSKHIDWLLLNQNKFFIIALGAAVKTLYKFGIKADAIINVDPNIIILNQFEGVSSEYLQDTIFIASTNTVKEVLSLFNQDNILYVQVFYDLINQPFFAGKSVGDALMNILLLLEFRNIYLLGTDLAIDQLTGASHSKDHIHYKEHAVLESYELKNAKFNSEDLIEVSGNFQDKVLTTRFFNSVKELYENHIMINSTKSTTIYNLSDGAFIEGTVPLNIDLLKLIQVLDKRSIIKKIINTLTLKELDLGKQKFTNVTTLNILLKDLNSKKMHISDSFNNIMDTKLNISIQIKQMAKEYKIDQLLFELILSFEKLTDPYFFKFISLKENRKDISNLQYLMNIWIELLIKIISKYMNIMNQLIIK